MDLMEFLSSGRKFLSFLRRTMDSRAIGREMSRCLSVFQGSGESLILEYGTISGRSSSPSLMAMRNLRRSAPSMSAIFESGFRLVGILVQELIDTGFQACEDSRLL